MITRLLDAVFGCWHSHYSFPITVRKGSRRGTSPLTGTYVVCLDCGKELPYDWHEMKVISGPKTASAAVSALAPKEAA
jgi:hypothetical protein